MIAPRDFPSTHSGELTLGTWLLQQPTHGDHGPTEHGRDASALQLHLKDPESSLFRPHIMPSGPLEHHLPIPSLLHRYISTIRDDRRDLPDALIYFVRLLRFLRNGPGVKTSDWWGRWLHPVNAAHAQSKSSSKLHSHCSTQPHITNLAVMSGTYGGTERGR
jgi:hypothetical protein